MPDESKILEGSFKSIPIRIISSSVSGGRKFVKKEFPSRDTQTIEDLGLQPRTYELQVIISDFAKTSANLDPEQDYFAYRDTLIASVENKGTGVLIHPLYGRVENVVATTYSINENLTEFGLSVLSVTLETTDDTGIPVQSTTALSQIEGLRQVVDTAVTEDIANNFSVSTKFTNNFIAAQSKINDIVRSAVKATAFIGAASDNINQFKRSISFLSGNVNSLIGAPDKLSSSVSGLFGNINNLFDAPENKAKAFINLFKFGV